MPSFTFDGDFFALGATAAMGRYEVAVLLGILNLFTMYALAQLKKHLAQGSE